MNPKVNGRRTMSRISSVLALFILLSGSESLLAQDKLNYPQQNALKQVVSRTKDAKKIYDTHYPTYQNLKKQMGGRKLPPVYADLYLYHINDIRKKLDTNAQLISSNSLPKAHSEVKNSVDTMADLRGKIDAWEVEMKGVKVDSEKAADPKNYPNLKKDVIRLGEIAKRYQAANFSWLGTDRWNREEKKDEKGQKVESSDPLALLKDFGPVYKWVKSIWPTYTPFIEATGGQNSPFYLDYTQAANALTGFWKKIDRAAVQMGKQFDENMAAAEESTVSAIKNKSIDPVKLIEEHFQKAKWAMEVLEAMTGFPPEKLVAIQDRFKTEPASIRARLKVLEKELIAAKRAPEDRYQGADRKKTLAWALRSAKSYFPKNEILSVRLVRTKWLRTVSWSWNGAGYTKYDDSRMWVTAVVKKDEVHADLIAIYLVIDNTGKEDWIYAGEEPLGRMLIQNLD